MSINKKICYPQETSSSIVWKQSWTHPTWRVRTYYSRKLPQRWTGGPGFRKKRNPAEEPSWAQVECNRAHWADWRMRQLQKANGRSSNGQQSEPEVEGDTRCRVAIGSKMWFEVAARLNGQRHKPRWIQLRHDQIWIERWREIPYKDNNNLKTNIIHNL